MKIKHVPLTGRAATVVASITNVDIVNSHRNLVMDGVNLYWQDDRFILKMPIRGRDMTVLDETAPNTPTAGLARQNGNIVYASVNDIRFVPTSGAVTDPSVQTIVTASSRVTTFHPISNGIYWGEHEGAIRVMIGSTITTISSNPFVPTSIFTSGRTSGGTVAWTECNSQLCQLHINFPVLDTTRGIGRDAFGVVVKSSGNVFWGDSNGMHRLVF